MIEIIPIFRIFLEISFVYIGEKRGYVKEMNKTVLIAIMLLMFLILGGCAGYSGNYRYDPYSGYNHYPYGYHGAPYGYQGHGYRGGWQHY
jgi:hypothetical protein